MDHMSLYLFKLSNSMFFNDPFVMGQCACADFSASSTDALRSDYIHITTTDTHSQYNKTADIDYRTVPTECWQACKKKLPVFTQTAAFYEKIILLFSGFYDQFYSGSLFTIDKDIRKSRDTN